MKPLEEMATHPPGGASSRRQLESRLAALEDLVRQMPCVMWITDRDLRVLDSYGKPVPDFESSPNRGRTLYEIFEDSVDLDLIARAHLEALAGNTTQYRHNFEGTDLQIKIEPHRDQGGTIVGCIGVGIDIGDRLASEAALKASEERFHLATSATSDVIWEWDLTSDHIWWSTGLEEVFGHLPADRVATYEDFGRLIHPADLDRVSASLREFLEGRAETWSAEYRFRRADGSWADVIERAYVQRDASGTATKMIGGMQDVTQRRRMEEDLRRHAFEDQLSGLPNRALFMDRLQHALEVRKVRRSALAVLFLDLDGFKSINDTLGHPAGDDLLARVALRLRRLLAPGVTLARFGGDEFAVLLEDAGLTGDTVSLATRFLAAIREPWELDSRAISITASIGIASVTQSAGEIDATEVMRRADAAMYRAKETGKDRYAFYEPTLDEKAFTHLEVELRLRQAIEKGELRLHFQPEVELTTGAIKGMEALVRWQHPDRGLLAPAEFIPIAEKTDLILAIDDWVFREACKQTAAWRPLLDARPDFAVGVNVSARQFARPGLPNRITAMLQYMGVSPEHLRLEITETATAFEIDAAVEQMRALKALGVRLAIDDFGTGFASLTYLRRFPIDVLKIDRSFIEDVREDPAARTIVRGLSTLAQLLNLSVTAEGIETAEQLHEVIDLGCSRGQGFYFSQPVTAAEATRLIQHGLPGFQPAPERLQAAG